MSANGMVRPCSCPASIRCWQGAPKWVISLGPDRPGPRAYVRTAPESYCKFGLLDNPARHGRATMVPLHNPRRMTMDDYNSILPPPKRAPWNKGKLIGAKPPLLARHVWSIRTRLQIERRTRDLAMFNLAIDSKWILVRQRLIGPPAAGLLKATPGSQTRSNQPLRMAGIPYHQVGKHKTSASAAHSLSTYLSTLLRLAPTSKYPSRSVSVSTGSKWTCPDFVER
jgi:hypothetical protein